MFPVVSMFSAALACRRDLANFLLKGIMSKVRSFREFPTPRLHCRLNWGFLGAPIAGWVIVENPIKMDDEMGVPLF